MAYKPEQIELIFTKILDRIEEGEPIRKILKEKDMPDSVTFYKWLEKDEIKIKQYARAKEMYCEKMFDEIFNIADATADDVIIDDEGKEIVNHNVIQRDRLRVDTRKWALSKLLPKKYGDKLDLTSGGEKIQTPVFTSNPLDDAE